MGIMWHFPLKNKRKDGEPKVLYLDLKYIGAIQETGENECYLFHINGDQKWELGRSAQKIMEDIGQFSQDFAEHQRQELRKQNIAAGLPPDTPPGAHILGQSKRPQIQQG